MSTTPGFLTIQQRLILDHLRHTRGSPITSERIVAAIYGNRWDGGPDYAVDVVRKQIRLMRKVLSPLGVNILTIGPVGKGCRGYMIDPDHLDRIEDVLSDQQRVEIEIARAR